MDKAQRVKTLIESGRFQEADRSWLEQVPEDRLSTLEAAPSNPDPKPAPASAPVAAAAEPPQAPQPVSQGVSPMTAEQYISQAPPELQESLREGLRVQQARRNELITALKATGRCDYTDDQLTAMQTGELERLIKLAAVPPPPSFVGRLNLRSREESSSGVPPAPSLADSIRAARQRN